MSLVILHPRIYAGLLESACRPHRSLKIRREIEMLRAKKRSESRTQINLNPEDASTLAGLIHASDLSRFPNGEAVRTYMEAIALVGVSKEGMENNSYIGYSSSEWKAMIEIASGLESRLDLAKVPATVFYDLSENFKWFEDYLGLMIARIKGIITQEELDQIMADMRAEDDDIQPIFATTAPEEEFALAFGARTEEENENSNQDNGDEQ